MHQRHDCERCCVTISDIEVLDRVKYARVMKGSYYMRFYVSYKALFSSFADVYNHRILTKQTN